MLQDYQKFSVKVVVLLTVEILSSCRYSDPKAINSD